MPQSDPQIADALPRAGATPAPSEAATAAPSEAATAAPSEAATAPPVEPQTRLAHDLVEDDLLVEDVSIDGMCGVY
jgi:mycofactocin precursor